MKQNIYDNKIFFEEYKQVREKDDSYNVLLEQPAILELLPSLADKEILDIGCGAGYNCKDFIKKGAKFCLGIDISKNMLALAGKINGDEKAEYSNIAIEDLSLINRKFDFIFSSLAFHYVQDFKKMFFDIKNLLKKGGELLFSIENPLKMASKSCSPWATKPGSKWQKDENGVSIFYKLSDYLSEGERVVDWLDSKVIKYHHTFSTIINTLVENGFQIEKVVEPLPTAEAIEKNPKLSREYHAPCFMIIKAKIN